MEGLEKSKLSKEDESQAVFKAPKLSYQERLKLWTGKDPLKCPGCQSEMVVIKIWTKAKGYIFDLLDVIKRTGRPPDELIWLQKVIPTDPKDIADQIYEQMSMDI